MPRSCPTCGSKKWRKDAVTGNAVCEEGHIFQDFRSENLDIDPLVGYALQKRRMRTGERINKRKVYGRANKEFYHGDEAEYLKLQAMQLLLRYQVQALKKLWSLPGIYENIVRELWSYQLLISPIPPVPDSDAPEVNDNAAEEGLVGMEDQDKTDLPEDEKEAGNESDASLEERYNKEDGSEDEDVELLRRLSEDEESSDKDDEPPDRDKEGRWKRGRRLVISDTVVTLVLGLWVLRYPVMNVHLERAVNDNQIPYLDFCHTSLLSPEMRAHMGKELVLALSPRKAPTPLHIFTQCRIIARMLSRKFGVVIPELNAPQIIWKTISPLGGSPTTYSQILRLLSLLNVNLSLLNTSLHRVTRKSRRPSSSSLTKRVRGRSESDSNFDTPTLSSDDDDSDGVPTRTEIRERPGRYHEVLLPELAVAAAWVVLLKMAYGLDGHLRYAISPADGLTGMPEGSAWVEELGKIQSLGGLKGGAWGLEKHDFTRLSEDDMDRFLAEAEQVLLRDRHDPPSDVSLFPLPPSTTSTAAVGERDPDWTQFHQNTTWTAPLEVAPDTAPRQLPLQPGEDLRIYDPSDETGILPPDLSTVLTAASDVVGVKEEELLRIVSVFERRLKRIKRDRSRSQSKSRERSAAVSRCQSRTGLRRAASASSMRSR